MTPGGTVDGDERLRLFCGLRLPDDVADRLSAWQREQLPDGRIVPRENLHVTLAFLGSRPSRDVGPVVEALRDAAGRAEPIQLEPVRYREGRSAGMLVLRDEAGAASRLADDLQTHLEELGVYGREARQWLPHVTVVRFKQRPRLRPPLPELGEFKPSDAAAYLSKLRQGGAEYVVLESVTLGG